MYSKQLFTIWLTPLIGKPKRMLAATIVSSLFVAMSVAIVEQILQAERIKHAEQARNNLNLQLMTAKGLLESAVVLDTYIGNSVATLATVAPDVVVSNWSVIAGQFIEKARFARSVALAPNDVIGYIYPLQGNEKALGLDFRSQTDQFKAVQQARESKDVVIAGPVLLVQGGRGVIIRYPVFTDFPLNQQYWGNISVVIDFDQLLQQAGLADITGANIALRGKDAKGRHGAVFYGDQAVFTQPDIEMPISFPGGGWLLAARYQKDALMLDSPRAHIMRVSLYLLCIFGYIALFVFYQAYKRSKQYAYYDELTGIANRRLMLKRLQELEEQPSDRAQYALLNIDLNKFKQINDSYGHSAGDALLRFVAEQLKAKLRSSDLVARMGGDEFMVLLYRLENLQQAQAQAAKLQAHFAGHSFIWQGSEFTVSLSIGAAHSNEVAGSAEDLIMLADKRMYQHKTAAKDANI